MGEKLGESHAGVFRQSSGSAFRHVTLDGPRGLLGRASATLHSCLRAVHRAVPMLLLEVSEDVAGGVCLAKGLEESGILAPGHGFS